MSSILLVFLRRSFDELYPICGNWSSGKCSKRYSITNESYLEIFQMIMFYFKLCLTNPIIGLKEYIMSQVSLNLMKIPLYWSVEIEFHLSQRQIYIEYLFKKEKVEGSFSNWNKYKMAAQTRKQDSTHKPGF